MVRTAYSLGLPRKPKGYPEPFREGNPYLPIMPLPLFALAASLVAQPAPDDFGAVFDKVSSMINRVHYSRGKRKDEFEKRFAKYKPIASKANSREEFSHVVNQMIAEFKDSHFEFLPNFSQGYYTFESLIKGDKAEKLPNIGAWFREDEKGWRVQMLLNGLSAEKAGLRKGDLVQKIDGQPFTPVESLRPAVGKDVNLTVLRGGKEMTFTAHVDESTAMGMFLDASRKSTRVIEKDGKKIGYFHLWTFGNQDFSKALDVAIAGPLSQTDAFVLDLRDGFGGRPEGFGSALWMPGITTTYGSQGMRQRAQFGYAKPMVALINEGSRSAKEVFSEILKKSKRATLVGHNTAGHVLGTSPIRLNEWAYIEIPIVEVEVDGKSLEGVGVAPDIMVKGEIDENGQDLILEKGLEEVSKKMGK